ncbi:MAG: hypothetical protein FJ280_10040 [Planctomycetes bacterium]|nr:hypothetical protein [Planctomycetota bacterium]
MNRSKRVAALLAGILVVWVGFGPQAPRAGERQPPERSSRVLREAKARPPAGSVDLRCQAEQPTTILFVVASGESVKKGDLLVELDASPLIDRRIQQVFQTRKTETDMIVARETQHWEKQAAAGRVEIAQKALRLAQGHLKAYTEAEHPQQLALAEGTARLARERVMMAEERYVHLRAGLTNEKDQDRRVLQEAQLALEEAKLQGHAAVGTLASLKDFGHANRVAELELGVAQREFDLARAQDALAAATARGGAVLQLAEISHQMEADRVAKMDDQVAKCKVYAPQDGTVVHPSDAGEAALRPGAVVRSGQVLLRLLPVTQPG